MAKKIRFPLVMENDVEVRSIEELREHFSLAQVLLYFENGKLVTWLRDRYENEIADKVEELDKSDANFEKNLCECFEVSFDEKALEDVEQAKEHNRKLGLFKQFGVDEKFNAHVDQTAFEQDDIYDLLDAGEKTIYLCGTQFSIPLSKKGIHYIGVNCPVIKIDSKTVVDFDAKNIQLEGIQYDSVYQGLLDDAEAELKKEAEKTALTQENAKSNLKYFIDYRYADTGLGVPMSCKALLAINLETGEEKIIYANHEMEVYDFAEFEKDIVLLTGRTFNDGTFTVVRYSKETETTEVLPVQLENVSRSPGGYSIHLAKMGIIEPGACIIEPEERTVLLTRTKVVYKDAWEMKLSDYQGNLVKEWSSKRNRMHLIASYNDDFYYSDGKSIYRYDTISETVETIADYGYKIIYDANAIYCIPTSATICCIPTSAAIRCIPTSAMIANGAFCWVITKISMRDRKSTSIFIPKINVDRADDIELKDGKLMLKNGEQVQTVSTGSDSSRSELLQILGGELEETYSILKGTKPRG